MQLISSFDLLLILAMVEEINSAKEYFNFSGVLFSVTEFGLSLFHMPPPGINCAESKHEKIF